MHEAFSTLGNIQESPTVYESAADCVIALLIRLEDQDNSAYINHLGVCFFFTTVFSGKNYTFKAEETWICDLMVIDKPYFLIENDRFRAKPDSGRSGRKIFMHLETPHNM